MHKEVLYGFRDDDLGVLRIAIEQALGIVLERHTNAYRGEHYVGAAASTTTLILQRNWDPFDGELMEEQFPDMRVLLYVMGSDWTARQERLLTDRAAHPLLRSEAPE